MERTTPVLAALAIAGVALSGCGQPGGESAYINSGATAMAVARHEIPPPAPPRIEPRPLDTGANAGSATAPASPGAVSTAVAVPDSAAPNAPTTASLGAPRSEAASGAVSETATTGKVKAALAADAGMGDSDISVTTQNGVVTLSGTVKSKEQVAIATSLAQRQEGVTQVESQLSVR